MKKLYLFAALAAMLAACSENDLTVNEQPSKVTETVEDAVNFDVYVGRGLTRGGVNGPITTELIKGTPWENAAHKAGFGVFGYYTDGEPYSAITKPNFFYNEQVTWSGSSWAYNPIKYWPNEFGGDAKSDQVDRVTLFAYLPWVDVDPLTGVVKSTTAASPTPEEVKATDPTTNIIGMTRNTATGDPFIKYSATMDPTNSVDLCYGVAADDFTSSNSAINQNDIHKGKPYIDVVKPGTDANSKIKFDFKHATAQLIVTIDANVVNKTTGATDINDKETRIWVRSVTFTGITQKGALNLNSEYDSPEWYDVNGNSKITTGSLTVYDGRKDGKEANDAANNETPSTLNPEIVQKGQYELNKATYAIEKPTLKGVRKETQDLFGTGTNQPVFVIPTKEKMRVTIVYDVETVDKNLPYYLSDGKTPGSTIQNTIYKDIDAFGDITAGYCYTLRLHLGMRTVDFDAEVTDWKYKVADVDLPSNLQTFMMTNPGTTTTVNLPANAIPDTYDFALSGAEASGTITGAGDVKNAKDASALAYTSSVVANGAGVAKNALTGLKANDDTKRATLGTATFKTTIGSTEYSNAITFKQNGQPLNLVLKDVAKDDPKLTIELNGDIKDDRKKTNAIASNSGEYLKIYRNGILQKLTDDYSLNDNLDITLVKNAQEGDIFTIEIKSGDVNVESATKTVPVTP